MPKRYEEIKESMLGRYTGKSLKKHAAMAYEATRAEGEEHIQTAVARERRRKKKRKGAK